MEKSSQIFKGTVIEKTEIISYKNLIGEGKKFSIILKDIENQNIICLIYD
jgi:hypothetical protein